MLKSQQIKASYIDLRRLEEHITANGFMAVLCDPTTSQHNLLKVQAGVFAVPKNVTRMQLMTAIGDEGASAEVGDVREFLLSAHRSRRDRIRNR